MKKIGSILVLMSLLVSAAFGSDNPILNKYNQISDVPRSFLSLVDPTAIASKTYTDDDGKVRKDKMYYTVYDTYLSTLRTADLIKLLDPSTGKLGTLFEETTVTKAALAGQFNVTMVLSTPIKDFDCESKLKVKTFKEGTKDVFLYTFTNFNMVFTEMVIRVEIEEKGSHSSITMRQIAALKGSTYNKLKNYFAIGKFEKALKANLNTFKDGVNGI